MGLKEKMKKKKKKKKIKNFEGGKFINFLFKKKIIDN